MDKTALGDRMKGYEEAAKTSLTRRMPMVIRVDGRAFHTYTKPFPKPWSMDIREGMTRIAQALLNEAMGAKLAYCQSDEVSVLVTDYDKLTSDSWFSKNTQKIASISASVATAAFNLAITNLAINRRSMQPGGLAHLSGFDFPKTAHFDARCFVLPKEEVCNYFVWRQQDARRNSISSLAQTHFSHKELHGKSSQRKLEMLREEREVFWDECETWKKLGWCVTRETVMENETTRTRVAPDWSPPVFSESRDYVERHVFLEDPQKTLDFLF